MKKLIKTHYREIAVDRSRIMSKLFHDHEPIWNSQEDGSDLSQVGITAPYWIRLAPLLFMAALLLVFAYFWIGFNFEFLSTSIHLYPALGIVTLVLGNILVGMSVFILEHFEILLLVSGFFIIAQIQLMSWRWD